MNVLILLLFSCFSFAGYIRDFQTSRLNATGGTGVASMLMTEAAILNPAAAAFFEQNSIAYQHNAISLKNENESRENRGPEWRKKNLSQGIFISDYEGPVKGGVSYQITKENQSSRERLTMHVGNSLGKNSAVGVIYRYTTDNYASTSARQHKSFHQISLGALHILDEHTIFGMVIDDPTRSNLGDEKVVVGIQHSLTGRLVLMGDYGARYTKTPQRDYLWRGALQLDVFGDLFIRGGLFYDHIHHFKGRGWGLGWAGPKLALEFSQRYTTRTTDENSYLYEDEKIVDTALNATLRY